MAKLSRRRFLGTTAALCACATSVRAAPTAAKPLLTLFNRKAVQLSPGPLHDQFEAQRTLFMGLDEDALLKPFRQRTGLPAPGIDMGGWYDDSRDFHVDPTDWSTANWHGYIPGHSFGQYVSGLSRMYAATGDAAIAAKVRRLIDAYAVTIGPKFFDGYYLPAYTYDKLAIGLIDAYQYAGVTEAKDALDRLTDAVLPFLPEKALTREERRQRPYTSEADIWDEPYTLPENLFLAWQLGMGDRYKDLAVRYLQDEALFDPLAQGISPLKGKHAYSHVNALNSAIEAYYATGDGKYLDAARNGFDFVLAQSYATGGWGPNEELIGPDDTETLYNMLTETHRTFETPCGAYGHFKIARHLLGLTRNSMYGDSMERVLYNTILGAEPTLPDGSTFYYSDYNQTASKFYRGEKWPCCSGTFIQLTADYATSAYVRDADNLYVNLYIPSRLSADLGGQQVRIAQTTAYPLDDTSRLTLSLKAPAAFTVHMRFPDWAGATRTSVTVNGKPWPIPWSRPYGFLAIARTWRDGDVIKITFDMSLRLETLDATHQDVVALMTGPLVLMPVGNAPAGASIDDWLSAKRVSSDTWRIAAKDITLKPFAAIGDETYRVYSRLTWPDDHA